MDLLCFFCLATCVCYAFVRVCLYVYMCLVVTCWERADQPLGSRLWCLTVSLSLSHWYLVVLDCINSLSLHPYLLLYLRIGLLPQNQKNVFRPREKPTFTMRGSIQRGDLGSGPPLKNHKNKGFLCNNGPDPLKNQIATEPDLM